MTSDTEVLYWLTEGVANRAVNSTGQNSESSRSHLILTLTVERPAATRDGATRVGKLLLVDLAGSERLKKTGAPPMRFMHPRLSIACG